MTPQRRHLVFAAASVAGTLACPALAASRRPLASMTEGPYYPPRRWREAWEDQDADLTRVQRGGRTLQAQGEHLGLEAVVSDTEGRVLDGCEVEIWQCDVQRAYRHPKVDLAPGSYDEGFQGFGSTRSDGAGMVRLRTIRPVAYPGRTPHIHVRLRHASFGELTSQLFVAGDPGNPRDGLWRRVAADRRGALEMNLLPAAADTGLRWQVRHALVVPA